MQRLKTMLVSTFFGLLAGISGAAVMLGWISPTVSGDWIFSRSPSSISRENLQSRAENKISGKVYSIYKKTTVVGSARYFSEEDIVSDGVMSVTSGWLATYIPNFDGKTKDWVAVAQNGSLYKVERSLTDPRTGFVFLKVLPMGVKPDGDDQFMVATFKSELKPFDNIFVYQDSNWLSTVVTAEVSGNPDSHLDSIPPLAFAVNDPFRDGSVAIDRDGNVIGFISGNKVVKPIPAVSYYLNGIEDKNKIAYPSLGVEGWFSEEKTLVINEEKTIGFIVTRVVGNRNIFQKGDIVLEINGREATWANLWYTMLSNNELRVKFLRGDRTLERDVLILQI